MSQYVTHIFDGRSTAPTGAPRGSAMDEAARARQAFRRRLTKLRTPASDTLRARIRRELRAAAAAPDARPE